MVAYIHIIRLPFIDTTSINSPLFNKRFKDNKIPHKQPISCTIIFYMKEIQSSHIDIYRHKKLRTRFLRFSVFNFQLSTLNFQLFKNISY